MTKVNKNTETTIQATAKSNILQADPILLSIIAEINKCQRKITNHVNSISLECNKTIAEGWLDEFDNYTTLAIGIVGDLVAMQIMSESEKMYCHE